MRLLCLKAFTATALCIIIFATVVRGQELIAPAGPVELLKGQFAFTEGPATDPSGNVYFSDIPNATIHRVTSEGNFEVFTDDSKYTNGMICTADGRLLGCQMDGAVVQYDLKTGEVAKVLADSYQGKRFNAPNDLIIDSTGGIYFTDPLYRAPEPLPQGVQAVYYIAENGTVSRVTDGISAPNGIALSPDESKLYVIPSMQAKMLVYEVIEPGKLGDQDVFTILRQPHGKSATGGDGMVVDVEGNLYVTTELGIQIFSPMGAAIGLVEVPEQPANVTFSGVDRKTLFITARTGVYTAPMSIAGLPSH